MNLTQQLTTQLLCPIPDLQVTAVIVLRDHLVLRVVAAAATAGCPTCQQSSAHRHSRYTRTLADVPWGAATIQIRLTVRKFRRANPTCSRQVFTERLPRFVAPYARQTARRQAALRAIGLARAGQAGARLAAQLGLPTSRDSLLCLVQQTPLPRYPAPRVVGIDDWFRRRGRHFGTILVDLERQRPLALLPDRQPDTVVAWLQQHPTIAWVSRDRVDGYAETIRRGAPHARQIADRRHLLKNLTETLETWFHSKRAAIKAARTVSEPVPADLEVITNSGTAAQQAAHQQRRARYQERYEQIQHLYAQQLEMATIARQVGVRRMTIYRLLGIFGAARKGPRIKDHFADLCIWRVCRKVARDRT